MHAHNERTDEVHKVGARTSSSRITVWEGRGQAWAKENKHRGWPQRGVTRPVLGGAPRETFLGPAHCTPSPAVWPGLFLTRGATTVAKNIWGRLQPPVQRAA